MSMRMRRREQKYEPLEVDANGGEQATTSTITPTKCSLRRATTCGPGCAALIKILFGTLATLVVFDVFYLQFQAWTFGEPCQIAQDIKQNLASSPRQRNGETAPPLPKIIHQQWKTENIPVGVFTEYHAQWKKLFPEPEYKHMLWTDESGRKLIADHFPWFLEAFDGYSMNIQRADSMRYFILYTYGGLYADLDYEPFVNFWDALPDDRVGLIESPYKVNEQVQNSLMSSPAGDPFWNVTFGVLYERRKSHKVLSSTGPAAMDAAMSVAAAAAAIPDPVHMLPCENFHRIPLANAGKNSPLITRFARTFMAYSPLVKTCGDWKRRDDCQYGLHHNSVSYMSNMGGNWLTTLKNF